MKKLPEINKNSTREDYKNFNRACKEQNICPIRAYVEIMKKKHNIK